MGVKVISEVKNKEVTFLTDVGVEFVSLVRHGANQMPFRVIKEEKGGESMNTIVQSILIPKTLNLSDLASEEELLWLNEVKKESSQDCDSYVKYNQIPVEKFEKDSLSMVKLHPKGAWAFVGKLGEGVDAKEALSLGKKDVSKLLAVPVSQMDQPIASIPMPAYVLTFGEMFEKELYGFLDVVHGVMNQGSADKVQRKTTVVGAIDAFKNFLMMGLDAAEESAGSGATKDATKEFVAAEFGKLKDMLQKAFTANKGGTTTMFTFETKEEFENAVKEMTGMVIEEKMKSLTPAPPADPAPAKTEDVPAFQAILDQMKTMNETLQGVVTKTDKLGDQFATPPASGTVEDPPAGGTKQKASIFAGMLTGKPTNIVE